jgi:type IV secretory pathway VirB2 component (pilin)
MRRRLLLAYLGIVPPREKRALLNITARGPYMQTLSRTILFFTRRFPKLPTLALILLLASPAFAQTGNSPWENAVNVLQQAFTSTIARGLSLVAIVVSGLTFAFGEGGSKRVLAGVLFGVGMAIAAVNFLAWLFPA